MYNRVPEMYIRPGPMPPSLRQAADAAGLTFKPQLPDSLAHATHRQGRPRAEKLMRHTTEELVKKGVRFGTGEFDPVEDAADKGKEEKALVIRPFLEKEIRQAFNTYDLDGNDFIDAAELRHIFAQIGEMPSDNEISAMILLCDPRGEGTVNFDDFLNVFANPADALRNANVKGIKHLLPRKKIDLDIRDPLGITLEEKVRSLTSLIKNIVMLSLAKGERPLLYFGRKIHCKVLYVFSGRHGRAKIFFPIPEKFPEKGKTLVFVAAPPIW